MSPEWKIDCHPSLTINASQGCAYQLLVSLIPLVSIIASAGTSSLVSGTLSHYRASNCFVSLWRSNVRALLSNVVRLLGISPNCSIYVRQRTKPKDGSGGRDYPGGLVITGSPTQAQWPAVQSLPSGLGKPAAVIQASPRRGSSAATTAAALCTSRPALGSVSPGEPKVISLKATPSSPTHSPVCRVNSTTTSMLLRRSSNAVAQSVCIPGPRPRSLSFSPSETIGASAVVIGVISCTPHVPGDRRESIEPSRCQDWSWETMVRLVLDSTHSLSRLARLICLPVRDSPSTGLLSATSGCPLNIASHLRSWRGWWCVPPDIPSHLRSLGVMKILVAPQSIRAHTRCISPSLSRIGASWIMCAESGVSVPHRYWLNVLALGLSKTTLDFSEIRWG